MTTLVLATRNGHKAQEIRAILSDRFRYFTLRDLTGAPETVEDAVSFAGNATKKAVELARWLGSRLPEFNLTPTDSIHVLADDSGLEVDALNGAPGVVSARFAAMDLGHVGNSSDADNNAKLVRLMKDIPAPRRTARFRCVIALTPVVRASAANASPVCAADELELQTELFDGACEGQILESAKGQGGFGYDPLFLPDGQDQTFGELSETVKNRISHRSKALAKLREWLANQNATRTR